MSTITLRIAIVIICVLFLGTVCHQIARSRLLLKYALMWISLATIAMLFALFPQPLFALSNALGFEAPSNFIFFAALFFMLAICLSLSIIASKQALRIKSLIQREALNEKRLEALEKLKDL